MEAEPPSFELVARRRHAVFLASRASFDEGKKKSSISNALAADSRRRGRIKEVGAVLLFLAPGSYVRPADSLEPAARTTVEPPAPFSGSATYRRVPKKRPAWSGDLKVEIPGFGTVGLAGRGGRTRFCEALLPTCAGGLLSSRASALLARLPR